MADFDPKRRDEELDRFWEIDDLIPKKKMPRYTADTEAVEITIDPPKSPSVRPSASAPKPHFIPPHTAHEQSHRPAPLFEYAPENALIRAVRIYPWSSSHAYYEDFFRNAKRLSAVVGVECDRVPFFSYVPQYTQMSRAQLAWYLWWRECFRNGRPIDTDYSYVLLYIFELINLATAENAKETQSAMLRVWREYHKIFRQLDATLPEWICDLSLIHRLPPPKDCRGTLLTEIMSRCALKEFYLPTQEGEDTLVQALLCFCTNYDYKKSKFYTDGREELFDRTVTGALHTILRHTAADGQLFFHAGMDDSKLCRDAFCGALCASRLKRRIEVDFCSFSRTHELRYLITDAIKYTENKLRAHWGIRSRLSVYSVPDPIRALLDAYLAEMLPARERATKKPEAPAEYERLYDLPRKELSLSEAALIEARSWETTERLIETFEDEPSAAVEIEAVEEAISPAPDTDTWSPYLDLLAMIAAENLSAQSAIAKTLGKPLEVLADEINSLAADLLEDILIEERDGGYTVIEDYRDVLGNLLRAHGKDL